MKKYEYEVTESSYGYLDERTLEYRSDDGWRLVTCASPATNHGSYYWYWEREIENTDSKSQ